MMNAGDALLSKIAALSGLFATSTSNPSASSNVMYGAGAVGGGA